MDHRGIQAALLTHAKTIGQFERVLAHEPKSAPGKGMTYALWARHVVPVQSSGMKSTSTRLTFTGRIHLSMLAQPEDDIDIRILEGTDAVMGEYTNHFTLGGLVRCVDLLGMSGVALATDFGYIELDKTWFRVATVTIPLIVDHVWVQTP